MCKDYGQETPQLGGFNTLTIRYQKVLIADLNSMADLSGTKTL